MSTYAISDLHGNLPSIPDDAESVLIAGDICPDFGTSAVQRQRHWLDTEFREWLDVRPYGCEVVATWGNHDYVGEHRFLVPNLPWTLLIDDETTLRDGRRVWGTPWVPNLPRWAFYGSRNVLECRADAIPAGIDILMTHGPPLNYGDYIPTSEKQRNKYGNYGGEHVGDFTLVGAIRRVEPGVTICGHIHEARGSYLMPASEARPDVRHRITNVAAVDAAYNLLPDPWVKI